MYTHSPLATRLNELTTVGTAPSMVTGLSPYTGVFAYRQAAHLLRRCMYGPKKSEIDQAVNLGLSAAVDALLAPQPLPSPPVNHFFTADPNVPIGATWVNAPYVSGVDVGMYRWPSIRAWLIENMEKSPFSIREKMTLFWTNHFGMADIGDQRAEYQANMLLRTHAIGNVKQLIKAITINPAMLKFLNGEYSNKWAPNENYARELLELFTIGKGPQVAPGDYTHYTEEDIVQIARVLTGWRNSGMWSETLGQPIESWFDANWHDEGDKTLSHRFGHVTINNLGADEYQHLIDIIFQQTEVSRFICRKLYRYFVYYDISTATEQQVIEPLAQILRDNDYDLLPVLQTLLNSQHFFDVLNQGPMIKHPYDFMMSILRPHGYDHLNLDLETRYNVYSSYYWWATTMEMDYLFLPSVSGWKAYYQSPQYYRNWINGTTLQQRAKYSNQVTGNYGFWSNSVPYPFDYLTFIAQFPNAEYPDDLIAQLADTFLPQPLHQDQLDALKEVLIPGLPDFEWTVEYSEYLSNPGNTMLQNSVASKVRKLFRALYGMAEFHLS